MPELRFAWSGLRVWAMPELRFAWSGLRAWAMPELRFAWSGLRWLSPIAVLIAIGCCATPPNIVLAQFHKPME